jgi:hypothetical protein
MKIKSLVVLGFVFILSGCVGVIERPAAVYVERRPAVIVTEPVTEVVIIEGRPVRRIIVAPHPIVIRRHHH